MGTSEHALFRAALLRQEALELQSGIVYLRMGAWFRAHHFPGAAGYLYRHAKEEFGHAELVSQYVADRFVDASAKTIYPLVATDRDLTGVNPFSDEDWMPQAEGGQARVAARAAALWYSLLEHEIRVTASLEALSAAATAASDDMAVEFISHLLREQREEERVIGTVARQWARNLGAQDLLDAELGKNPPK
jgi:ferritin